MKKILLLSIISTVLLSSCGDDDEPTTTPTPTTSSFTLTIENVATPYTYAANGVFNTPDGSMEMGPIADGGSYSFSFYAGPSTTPGTDTRLSFALMLIKSNDIFFAPVGEGIDLYDEDGNAVTGDVTDQVALWDAGTEVNQEPGGEDSDGQPLEGNMGSSDEDGNVMVIADGSEDVEGFTYPDVNDLIEVTITNPQPSMFTVTITNVSGESELDGPFSPGAWVVHTANDPLFTAGAADFGNGLEAIAEDGNPATLDAFLSDDAGFIVPLSPGAWAVHSNGSMPLFTSGEADTEGVEGIAEDGVPTNLAASLAANTEVSSSGVFNTPVGSSEPAAIGPGASYEMTFTATEGDYFNFATMYIQSNDLFYAFADTGIALFDSSGEPISGDITSQLTLWDAGTEVNEFPGAGLNQAIRQSGANTGDDENGTVSVVDDGFTYESTSGVIKVTITPN